MNGCLISHIHCDIFSFPFFFIYIYEFFVLDLLLCIFVSCVLCLVLVSCVLCVLYWVYLAVYFALFSTLPAMNHTYVCI